LLPHEPLIVSLAMKASIVAVVIMLSILVGAVERRDLRTVAGFVRQRLSRMRRRSVRASARG